MSRIESAVKSLISPMLLQAIALNSVDNVTAFVIAFNQCKGMASKAAAI